MLEAEVKAIENSLEPLWEYGWDESGPDYGYEEFVEWFAILFSYIEELKKEIAELEEFNDYT